MFTLGNGVYRKKKRYLLATYLLCLAEAYNPFFRQEIWVVKGSKTDVQIYLSPALIDTIKDAYFATPTAFGFKFMNHFVSSHPTLAEPEMTIPLVALGATAVSYESVIMISHD